MARVIILIDSLGSGGAQRQVVNTANLYQEHGNDVTVMMYHNEFYFREELDENICLKYYASKCLIIRLLNIIYYLALAKPDVAMSYLEMPSFLLTALKYFKIINCRVVISERSAMKEKFNGFRSKVIRRFYANADVLWTNSRANMSALESLELSLPEDRRIIYNLLQQEYLMENLPPYEVSSKLLFVGSISRVKNIEFLFDLANKLTGLGLIETIDLYGEIKDRKYFNELKKKNYFVIGSPLRYMGESNEIRRIYDSYNFLVMCSHSEGFPNVLLEAMSRGCYVLSSDVGDARYLAGKENVFAVNDIEGAVEVFKALLDRMLQKSERSMDNVDKVLSITEPSQISSNLLSLL